MPALSETISPDHPMIEERYEAAVDLITHAAVAFLYERDFPSSLASMLSRTSRNLQADRAALFQVDGDDLRLHGMWCAEGFCHDTRDLAGLIQAFARWRAQLEEGSPVSASGDQMFAGERALLRHFHIGSLAVAPVYLRGRWWGGLLLADQRPDREWSPLDRKALMGVAGAISAGLRALQDEESLRQSKRRIERGMQSTIEALLTTIEMRDPYTAGHQRRVAGLAGAIAGEMGLGADDIRGIHTAGLMHDIGKVCLPAEILARPGRLAPEEFNLVKRHVRIGYEITADLDFPWPVATMILQHHEKLDGSGYPDGVSGDAILLGSRILCVADVVEAMASHRPYRPALGLDAALEQIAGRSGTQFDADAVACCDRLLRSQRFSL